MRVSRLSCTLRDVGIEASQGEAGVGVHGLGLSQHGHDGISHSSAKCTLRSSGCSEAACTSSRTGRRLSPGTDLDLRDLGLQRRRNLSVLTELLRKVLDERPELEVRVFERWVPVVRRGDASA